MATILAKNTNGKGIIILTHNELEYLYPYLELGGIIKKSKSNYLFKLYKYIYLFKNRFLKKKNLLKIYKLKDNFLIGVHWGFDINYIPKLDFIDFHLGFNKISKLVHEEFINFTSRNFSSEFMRIENNVPKYWDFITVSSNQKRKNLIRILQDFRKLFSKGKYFSLLLIVPTTGEKNDDALINYYFKNFSFNERNYITILKLDSNLGFLGLPQKQLSLFYKMSKIYISYSEAEGEPRTIHEAQLCGLPIVFYSMQLGGGKDYLDQSNTVFFNDFKNSYLALLKSYEDYDKMKSNTLNKLNDLKDTNTNINLLIQEIKKLYLKKNLDYKNLEFINLDNLNLRLPTHLYEYKSETDFINSSRFSTGNIKNYKDLNNFINLVNN